MPLTDDQKARLEALAKEEGVDPAALLAEAEAARAEDEEGPGMKAPGAPAAGGGKIFAWSAKYFLVVELRAQGGCTKRVPGDELFTFEFDRKHGLAAKAGEPATDE